MELYNEISNKELAVTFIRYYEVRTSVAANELVQMADRFLAHLSRGDGVLNVTHSVGTESRKDGSKNGTPELNKFTSP